MYYHLIYYLTFLRFTLVSSATQAEINRLQTSLVKQYKVANYEGVVKTYDSLKVKSYLLPPALLLYVAHAAEKINDTTVSQPIYRNLSKLSIKKLSPIALNQLGVWAEKDKKYEQALVYFKEALMLDSELKPALYNYELIYKKNPPKSKNVQNQAQQQQIEENFEQVIATQQNEEKKDLLSQATPPKMERERALQLLDAMRANELQGGEEGQYQFGRSSKKSEKNW